MCRLIWRALGIAQFFAVSEIFYLDPRFFGRKSFTFITVETINFQRLKFPEPAREVAFISARKLFSALQLMFSLKWRGQLLFCWCSRSCGILC